MRFLIFISYIFIISTTNISASSMNSAQSKQRILQEFRQKLLEEEELQKELQKNRTLTNEDLDDLVKKDETTFKDILDGNKLTDAELEYKKQQELEEKKKKEEEKKRKKEQEKKLKEEEKMIKREEKRIKEEEERLLKEEKEQKKQQSEEEKRKRQLEKEKLKKEKDNLKKRQDELDKSKDITDKEIEEYEKKQRKTINGSDIPIINYESVDNIKSGITDKIYNITDTGVSIEFLYSKEYQELMNTKTTINKHDTNKEEDIPVLKTVEKNIINFDTTDIPSELLAYKRSEENRHIPSIMSVKDLQYIALKAIEYDNLPVLRGIIEETKDPDFLVGKNRTLLNVAIENNKYSLARYLIYGGASINRVDNKLNNPLHIAIINYNIDIATLLIENNINIDAQNIDGNTPLILSILTNQDKLTIRLLKSGANVKLKNKNGDDAMDICIKNNKRKIQQYLREIIREEEINK